MFSEKFIDQQFSKGLNLTLGKYGVPTEWNSSVLKIYFDQYIF
jgi:hypothetical protein